MKQEKIDKANFEDIIALTPTQEGMLYHYLLESDKEYYFEQLCLFVEGSVDVEIFHKAWSYVTQSNELLRSVFRWETLSSPIQVVLKQHKPEIETVTCKDVQEMHDLLERYKIADKSKGFDLENVPFRITLFFTDNQFIMMLSHHHILFDGWSTGILLKEFFEAYQSITFGRSPVLVPKAKYNQFVKMLKNADSYSANQYWKTYLKEIDNMVMTSNIVIQGRMNHIEPEQPSEYKFELSGDITGRLMKFAKSNRVTLASMIYAAWGIVLQRFMNTNDVVFGAAVSGRNVNISGIENTIGLFINTLPVRFNLEHCNVIEALQQLHQTVIEREGYEHTPLVAIKQITGRSINDSLFDTVVVIDNYPLDKILTSGDFGGLQISSYSMSERSHYKVMVSVVPGDKLQVTLNCDRSYFTFEEIVTLAQSLEMVLNYFIHRENGAISDIELLNNEETQLLKQFNATTTEYPRDQTISQVFENQVKQHLERIAVVHGEQTITYKDLHRKSDQLAKILRDKYGVKKGHVVGIYLEKTIDMVIALLAVLKANAVCLPLDIKYPQDRISYMCSESKAEIILKRKNMQPQLTEITYVDIDCSIYKDKDKDSSLSPLEECGTPEELAYLIFTSGSTGVPKGVMLHHRGIINHAYVKIKELEINSEDKICFNLNTNFVASIWQVFSTLFAGATIVIYENDITSDPLKLMRKVDCDKITILEIIPSFLSAFMQQRSEINNYSLGCLKYLVLTGEKVNSALVKDYYSCFGAPLVNAYGQSECSDDTLHYKIPKDVEFVNVPIGIPTNNTEILILNNDNKVQPIGWLGEICIAGDGLALGYLNQSELTSKAFIPHPFDSTKRIYKTGDLGRWLSDGKVLAHGRLDYQVKIRGHRVELGEIENRMMRHEIVTEAVVVARKDRLENNYLTAYYKSTMNIDEFSLRSFMESNLPESMVPSHFVRMHEWPLNQNGKIDKLALPSIVPAASSKEVEAPQNKVEEKLLVIWQAVLPKQEAIGTNDNFFKIGGHSLNAVSLAAQIGKQFEILLSIQDIFNNPTIKKLAAFINRTEKKVHFPINPVKSRSYYPVSFSQKGLFIHQQAQEESITYNMPTFISLEGNIDTDKITNVFIELIQRHEALRTSFAIIEGEIVQVVHEKVEFEIAYLKTDEKNIKRVSQQFVRYFDLSIAPLIRVGIIKISETKIILLIDMHHIISDGASFGILIEDFITLYQGNHLETLSIQFKDFSVWQHELLRNDEIRNQENYWKDVLKDVMPLELPTDFSRPSIRSNKGSFVQTKLEDGIVADLYSFAQEHDVTVFMILLATFNILLHKITSQEDIVVGSPVSGRTDSEVYSVFGLFVNSLALRNFPCSEKTFMNFLHEIKRNSLEAIENQDFPYAKIIEIMGLSWSSNRNPLFDVVLSMESLTPPEQITDDIKMFPLAYEQTTSKYDLHMEVMERKSFILLKLNYSSDLYSYRTADNLITQFVYILSNVIKHKHTLIRDIELIERVKAVVNLDDTEFNF
ncbi:amino acid adenylation domain-containing protein [Paenibacillus pabuli]|uniref:amino acid adenylation domain-containing protein n=1 Tax=Paenibacillus pabuli TaxID=1472 RepID=UPI003CF6194C